MTDCICGDSRDVHDNGTGECIGMIRCWYVENGAVHEGIDRTVRQIRVAHNVVRADGSLTVWTGYSTREEALQDVRLRIEAEIESYQAGIQNSEEDIAENRREIAQLQARLAALEATE